MTANDYISIAAALNLSAADLSALDGAEQIWFAQASNQLSADDLTIAASEWQQWLNEAPGFRLAAYADNFSAPDVGKPQVLSLVPQYQSDISDLIDKARTAAAASSAPAQSSFGTVGLVLIAAGLWWFLKQRR